MSPAAECVGREGSQTGTMEPAEHRTCAALGEDIEDSKINTGPSAPSIIIKKIIVHPLNKSYLVDITKILIMATKVITVKASATLASGAEFKEYEYPELNKLLGEGYVIQDFHQATTNVNTGFIFFTFVLYKKGKD